VKGYEVQNVVTLGGAVLRGTLKPSKIGPWGATIYFGEQAPGPRNSSTAYRSLPPFNSLT
jgi:hypothetical protein